MPTFRVKSSSGSYDILCARGALTQLRPLLGSFDDVSRVFVLSSPRVWRACGKTITGKLPTEARRTILFDDSETAKRMSTVEAICRGLVRAGADRRAVLIAIGGGVVGDVAGFAAASYLRGVRVIHVPTTIVAQVDSSIGGKTGVDLPEGKNLVGAFYPPKAVVIDPELLKTLPHREFRSGLYEVVKYGVIADRQLFEFLEKRLLAVLRRDLTALDYILSRSIAIKARVVTKDEREGGSRQILNFGHTLGHALETATNYRRFLHGEAIGWGMIYATTLSAAAGRLSEANARRVIRLSASVGPLPPLTGIRFADLRRIMAGDKKSRGGRVKWVLARSIGQTEWGKEVAPAITAKAFNELPGLFANAQGEG
jgi:3-dehydroquinate synthase